MLSKCFLYVKYRTPQLGKTTASFMDRPGRSWRPWADRTFCALPTPRRGGPGLGRGPGDSEPPRAVCTSVSLVGCNCANFSLKMVRPSSISEKVRESHCKKGKHSLCSESLLRVCIQQSVHSDARGLNITPLTQDVCIKQKG